MRAYDKLLGKVGVFSAQIQKLSVSRALEDTSEWESLGYRALWIPEGPIGRDALTYASVLLAGSSQLVVATAVAMIWARDPVAMVNGARTLNEAYPQRFILGLGVSHSSTAAVRGHEYRSPLSAMRSYLEAMDRAEYIGPSPAPKVTTVIGALGPRMIELAAQLADGVHPFLSTPAHTAATRQVLGPDKLLAVEQSVVLSLDRKAGLEAANNHFSGFVGRENYANHFKRMGLDGEGPGHTNRLLEALYAVGDEQSVLSRVREHLDAGADHVCVNIVAGGVPESEALRDLAPALTALR